MALYGNTVGSLKMLFSLGEIHQRLERSIALDPTYAEGGAFRLLGLIREKLPGLLGGSDRRARDYYEKAIHSAPEAPLNYLLMARLLKDRFGKLEESAEFVRLGALLPEPGVDRLENREAWTELRSWPSKTAP